MKQLCGKHHSLLIIKLASPFRLFGLFYFDLKIIIREKTINLKKLIFMEIFFEQSFQ